MTCPYCKSDSVKKLTEGFSCLQCGLSWTKHKREEKEMSEKEICAKQCAKCKYEFEEKQHPLDRLKEELRELWMAGDEEDDDIFKEKMDKLLYEGIKWAWGNFSYAYDNAKDCLESKDKERWIV